MQYDLRNECRGAWVGSLNSLANKAHTDLPTSGRHLTDKIIKSAIIQTKHKSVLITRKQEMVSFKAIIMV